MAKRSLFEPKGNLAYQKYIISRLNKYNTAVEFHCFNFRLRSRIIYVIKTFTQLDASDLWFARQDYFDI